MVKQIERLTVKRDALKAAIERIKDFVGDTVGLASASNEMLVARKDRLVSTFREFEEVSLEISLHDPENKDSFCVEKIETTYYELLAKLNQSLKTCNDSVNSNVSNSKLPNIDLQSFDGKDFTKFKPFLDLFSALIDNNKSLSNIQKLFYLRKYLTGEALSVIVNLPVVNESYNEALSLLKKRFDNKARLIANHVTHLLDLPQMQKGTASSIRSFVSEVQQQLYALKNLEQPIQHWDMLLISILSRKLDSYTSRAYHLDRQDPEKLPTIEEFLSYLEKRAIALEDSPAQTSAFHGAKPCANKVTNIVTQEVRKQTCIYCENNHPIFLCPKFKTVAISERLAFVNSKALCNICLKPHTNKCKFNFKCKNCKMQHNTLLHEEAPEDEKVGNHCSQSSTGTILLPTIRVKLIGHNGQEIHAKALVDSGSQASFIKAELANKLCLTQLPSNTKIIGICNNPSKLEKYTHVVLHSCNDDVKLKVACHIVDTITSSLPQQYIDTSKIVLPAHVMLADSQFNVPSEITILLGADIYFKILQEGQINLKNGLVLQNTSFGHIVGGSVSFAPTQQQSNIVSNFVMQDKETLTDVMSKFWLSEKMPEESEATSDCQKAENIFQESVKLVDDRFYVDMPLKAPMNELQLGDSFSVALQRFYALESKFKAHPEYFQKYKNFIDEYVNLGHAKEVDISTYDVQNDPVYFLAHHAVLNEDSKTTKLRVVFNGSMNSKTKVSLNDKMFNGPTVQSELFDILTLFRTYRYTLMCDIEKMFRQVYLNESQKGLINILWRDSPQKPISCLQLQTVTYGLKASTFLSTRCLVELALRFHDEYPLASEAIMKNTYVDDVITGCDNIEELEHLKKELIGLLKLGSFNLHKWCSNVESVLADIPENQKYFEQVDINKDHIIKTLGLKYNVLNDELTFTAPNLEEKRNFTKREILSFIGKMFDPLGIIGPVIVKAKLYMQELWALKVNWDSILPERQLQDWETFLRELQEMGTISTPRSVLTGNVETIELVGYCDASSKAIGCCIYMRVINKDGSIDVTLLCSRSKVAPLSKTLTIPNLELNSAVLLSELVYRVHNLLKSRFPIKVYLYSDSQIVLSWLMSGNLKSTKYVTKRVCKIKDLTSECTWAYVRSAENPADLLSRGIAPQKLVNNTLWWKGPQYLTDPMYQHNSSDTLFQIKSQETLKKTTEAIATNVANIDSTDDDWFFNKYSDLNKLLRVLAYMLRFCHNCKNAQNKVIGDPSPQELENAFMIIIRKIQHKYFSKEIECLLNGTPIKTGISSLYPFLDKNQILRTGGRLQNAKNISFDKMHPMIIPKSCHITRLLIEREHLRLLHVGAKLVLSSLSQKFTIINGIREVKNVLLKCVKCFQLKAAAAKQLMGSLPEQRVTASRPFEVTGIDYCGPFEIKISRIRKPLVTKAYIAIFVCFTTKAVHAELVSDLTTEAFLACLKRFIARRGLPRQIFCDNAQTFRGASNKLKELYKLNSSNEHRDIISNYCSKNYITFKFIPSYSPEFGGLWEASVKSLKYHLKRVVGKLILTFEELYTVITQVEAVLNSRPLLSVSAETSDYTYLTPGHFLTGAPLTSFPEVDYVDTNINRLKFWKQCEKIKQDFWKVWSRDYLTQLQNRPKWRHDQPNLKEGDLVIVRTNNSPPLDWPMARIVKVIPGPDGKVRVAEIKMAGTGKLFVRSYTKLCPLPINE